MVSLYNMKTCLFLYFTLGTFLFVAAQKWELNKNKNGITIYTRSLDSTQINEYKAVLLSNTTIEKALKVITDGDNLWKWNHNTSKSKTLKRLGNNEFFIWMKNDLP